MARGGNDGRRSPQAIPSKEDRRLADLLSIGAFGIGAEILGALYGDAIGWDIGAAGFALTLAAALAFALNLAYVQGRERWRRGRR